VIKHNVVKFTRVYKSMAVLNEYGASAEDIIDCAHNLNKVKHHKQQPFLYVYCWHILKDGVGRNFLSARCRCLCKVLNLAKQC
jgi:hypothetical protein